MSNEPEQATPPSEQSEGQTAETPQYREMKFSQTPGDLKSHNINYINQRLSQLVRLEEEAELRALKYLLLTNSGGAIAVASFLSSVKDETNGHTGLVWALIIFLFGLGLSGVLVAYSFHFMKGLLDNWRKDYKDYFDDKIDWQDLISRDENRWEGQTIYIWIAYGSFTCFIFGSGVALFNLLY